MNLASQSVLEGLNACFDHRGEIFLSELGRSFRVDRRATKFFACQNPYRQGGDRRGLPKSFMNRFSVVRCAAWLGCLWLHASKNETVSGCYAEILRNLFWGRAGTQKQFYKLCTDTTAEQKTALETTYLFLKVFVCLGCEGGGSLTK